MNIYNKYFTLKDLRIRYKIPIESVKYYIEVVGLQSYKKKGTQKLYDARSVHMRLDPYIEKFNHLFFRKGKTRHFSGILILSISDFPVNLFELGFIAERVQYLLPDIPKYSYTIEGGVPSIQLLDFIQNKKEEFCICVLNTTEDIDNLPLKVKDILLKNSVKFFSINVLERLYNEKRYLKK